MHIKFIVILFSLLINSVLLAQNEVLSSDILKPNLEKEAKFLPYLAIRHGGMDAIENWKKENTLLYYKELWYFAESFYIKRDHLKEGIEMDESAIDIGRYESYRKEDDEAIVILPGFKDALVLLPLRQLIYKPNYRLEK